MRTHDGYDAQDSHEQEEDAMGENFRNGNDDIDSNERRFQKTPSKVAAKVAATMISLIKAQEEQHQLNAAMLQSLTDLQRKIDSGRKGSKSSTKRRRRNSSGSSDSEESSGDTSSSSRKKKIRRNHRDHSRDEFKKDKPPTFDGEIKTGQEAEAWLLGIKKYFQVQYYSGNMKARFSIFNLNGRASIWWEHFKQVKKISERRLKWKQFKKYFKQKY